MSCSTTASTLHHFLCATSTLVWSGGPLVAQQGRTLEVREVRRIASEGPGYVLARVGGAAIGPMGVIAVLEATAPELLLFDGNSGHLLKKVGRVGSGPGEYVMPRGIGATANSRLWVWDRATARLTLFRWDGGLDTSFAVPSQGVAVPKVGGGALVFPIQTYFGRSGSEEMRATILSIGMAGRRPDTVLDKSLEYRTLAIPNGQGGFIVGRQPFTDETLIAPSSMGDGFVIVERKVTSAPRPSVRVVRYSENGRVIFDVRIPYQPFKAPEAVKRAAIEALFRPFSKSGKLKRQDFADAIVVPAHLPSVTSALIGSDSTVWLRREHLGQPFTRWTVLSPAGAILGTATLPSRLRLLSVSSLMVVAASEDQDEAPDVTLYRVGR